jgi:hypothetical protein
MNKSGETKKMHISESAHWYREDGTSAHEVPDAKGKKMIKTTIVQAKKLNLFPSVTSIMNIISKPFVDNWRIDMYMKEIYLHPEMITMDYENWREKIMEFVEPKLNEGARRGSEIHSAICDYFGDKPFDVKFNKLMDNFREKTEAIGLVKGIVVSEKGYCHKELGYAGCVDVTCGSVLADMKTTSDKHFANLQKYPYREWKIQLSAYNRMLLANGIATDTFHSIIINRDTDEVAVVTYDKYDLDKSWEMFNALLNYWKIANEYYPERKISGEDINPF